MLIPFTLCVKFASSTYMACICLNALITIVYIDFASDAFCALCNRQLLRLIKKW